MKNGELRPLLLGIGVGVVCCSLVFGFLWYAFFPSSSNLAVLTSEKLAVQAVKNEIYRRFFEIFITVTALLAGISAICGVGVYSVLNARVERAIEKQIDERIRVAQARTLSISFNEFGYPWYVIYEPLLQKCLSNRDAMTPAEKAECQSAIGNALRLVNQGDEVFTDLDPDDQKLFLGSTRGLRARAHILNQILYGETAKIIVSGKWASIEYTNELVEISDQLFEIGVTKMLADDAYNWWEAVETVAFFKVWIGKGRNDQDLEADGIRLLRKLTTNQPPKRYLRTVPDDVRKQIIEEYTANGVPLYNS